MTMKCSEAQGRSREARSERSVEQIRELTDRNRIQGNRTRTSGLKTAKSKVIKDAAVNSAVVRRKSLNLPREVLHCVLETRLREPRGDQTAAQNSAEGVVAIPIEQATKQLGSRCWK